MARRFEYVVPIEPWRAKEALSGRAHFLRRSKIEDAFYEGPNGTMARLRRQDTLSRLSCTAPLPTGLPETVVIDHRACAELLASFGFRKIETIAVTRDIYRCRHFHLFVDRVEKLGTFLVVEAEAGKKSRDLLERTAKRLIRELSLFPEDALPAPWRTAIDMTGGLPYTGAIEIAA